MNLDMISISAIQKYTGYPLGTIAEWMNRPTNAKQLSRRMVGWLPYRHAMVVCVGLYLNVNFTAAARFYHRAKKMIAKNKGDK